MSTAGLVRLTIDGMEVALPPTKKLYDAVAKKDADVPTTIFDAAAKLGIKIPVLCHREHMKPVAVCRVCCVDVGGRVLAPACYRPIEEGMKVQTGATSEKVRNSVKVLTELLVADHPPPREKQAGANDNELLQLAQECGIKTARFPPPLHERGRDGSSLVIDVDHNACILCDRCVRGCNEVRGNEVLGRAGKGYRAHIAFDLDTPMGNSSCVSCGECMVSCPTGALTFRSVVRPEPWIKVKQEHVPVSTDDLARLPLFEGVSNPFLRWNEGSVIRRQYKKGDIICREGEFGSTAFFIEKGKVNIFIQAPLKHVKSRKGRDSKGGLFGLVRRFSSGLVGRDEDPRGEGREADMARQFIQIDAPVSLDYNNPTAVLDAGQIFGEMTCMSQYPRSATVQAAGDVTVLEMLRNVLYILQRSKSSKAMLDRIYRERAVVSLLRSVPIFASLFREEEQFKRFIEYLRDRVQLMRLNPGEVIFRQGDPADSFYLVRIGFVKVSQRHAGGEHVLTYVGPGGYFGEIGLMWEIPEIKELILKQYPLAAKPVRSATCAALDHVDVVRLSKEDFYLIFDYAPEVRDELVKRAVQNLVENESNQRQVRDVSLGQFLQQGLMNAQSLLVLDLEKCTRCDECTKACADAHDGVTRLIREGLRFDRWLVASSCRSCLDPYCMVGCPVGSIRRRNSREIIIEDWCIGCGKCAENCPYGNINMHGFPTGETFKNDQGRVQAVIQQKATTCDLCSELDGQPSCVYACPHDAAHRMTGAQLLASVDRS